MQARTVEWSRHSYRQALRDVLLRSTSCEEWFSLLHPTLLEGVRSRGARSVVKKEYIVNMYSYSRVLLHLVFKQRYIENIADIAARWILQLQS